MKENIDRGVIDRYRWNFFRYICSSNARTYIPTIGAITYFEAIFFVVAAVIVLAIILSAGEAKQQGTIVSLMLFITVSFSIRNNIVQFCLGIPWQKTQFLHKMFALITLFGGLTHGIPQVYTDFNSQDFCGVMIIVMIAIQPLTFMFRHYNFEAFYYIHLCTYGVMMYFAYIHGAMFVLYAAAFLGLDIIARLLFRARKVTAQISFKHEGVVQITFEKPWNYTHGQCVFIMVPKINPFQFHPFSIASIPSSNQVVLYAGVVGGWTRDLMRVCETATEVTMFVEGPYGSPTVDFSDTTYKTIVVVSGGTGVTHNMSLIKALRENAATHPCKVIHIWTLKDRALGFIETSGMATFESVIDMESGGPPKREVEMTTNPGISTTKMLDYRTIRSNSNPTISEGFQLINNFFITDSKSGAPKRSGNPLIDKCIHDGRPHFLDLLTKIHADAISNGEERIAVSVCGPMTILANLTKTISKITKANNKCPIDCDYAAFEL